MPSDTTITLTGWGQPAEALQALVPHARPVCYAALADTKRALALIAEEGANAQTVIGWSLGGQLAVRAIAQGMIHPKKLILIATPYQFVESDTLLLGMKQDTFDTFKHNYAVNPKRTLRKAHALIALGDSKQEQVRHMLEQQSIEALLEIDWYYWLSELEHFSCQSLSYHNFPETILIHGLQDAVVAPAQLHAFDGRLPKTVIHCIDGGVGHAPHWHDPDRLTRIMNENTTL